MVQNGFHDDVMKIPHNFRKRRFSPGGWTTFTTFTTVWWFRWFFWGQSVVNVVNVVGVVCGNVPFKINPQRLEKLVLPVVKILYHIKGDEK